MEAETAARSRDCSKAKAREKAEIARISAEAREKMETEEEVRVMVKEKEIPEKRMEVEDGYVTKVRVEAKAEVRDWNVGILTDVLNKVKAVSNGLKSIIV